MNKIAQVILPIAVNKEFDYFIPARLNIKEGVRVLVDFHGKKRMGIVAGLKRESAIKNVKPIIDVLDKHIILNKESISLARRLTKIYPYTIGDFLFMMLPAYLKKIAKSDLPRNANIYSKKNKKPARVFIKGNIFQRRYQEWKKIAAHKLQEGSVLVCFPQVSYLKEARKVIEKDFPGKIREIYSQQKPKELSANWKETRSNAFILGTRVSIFYYPLDLSLIVVEEENSPYYFQEKKPYHHLLDVALILSKIKAIDLILSGDYPTLSTYQSIKEDKICLTDTSVEEGKIKIIDIPEFRKKRRVISPLLEELLRRNIEGNKRAVILWNRLGFGRIATCLSCGYIFKCEHCSGLLNLSLKENKGICPYCYRKFDLPGMCPKCNEGYIKPVGCGIERVGVILKRIFPDCSIDKWEEHKANSQIILSTSKILSFLYSQETFDSGYVLDIDSFLSRLDYAATFDSFLYLKKLSLFFKEALYVFTRNRTHYLFTNLDKNWRDFYDQELSLRKELGLPPFGLIAKITLRAEKEDVLKSAAENLYNRLKKRKLEAYEPFCEHPFKLRDKFRYSVIIKAKKSRFLHEVIKEEVRNLRSSHIKLAVIIK
ncbi:MAG: hypothetical protein ABIK26_05390 [Candidatus Omnitrophota bacterium]